MVGGVGVDVAPPRLHHLPGFLEFVYEQTRHDVPGSVPQAFLRQSRRLVALGEVLALTRGAEKRVRLGEVPALARSQVKRVVQLPDAARDLADLPPTQTRIGERGAVLLLEPPQPRERLERLRGRDVQRERGVG